MTIDYKLCDYYVLDDFTCKASHISGYDCIYHNNDNIVCPYMDGVEPEDLEYLLDKRDKDSDFKMLMERHKGTIELLSK